MGKAKPKVVTNLRVQAIGHQLKLAVRRDERNSAIVFKSGEPNALVELHIF
jgi:hypothetical protein